LNNEEDESDSVSFISNKMGYLSSKITGKHVWTFDEIQNALLNSPFIRIPTEILLNIFGLLSVRDLGNISLVCRYFKMITDQDVIWKTRCNSKSSLFSLFKLI
jgi:hypothetical protein